MLKAGDVILEKQKVTEYSISPRLKEFAEWVLKDMASGDLDATFPAGKRAALVEELWKDSAIQATYTYSNELQAIPETMSYFLERVRYSFDSFFLLFCKLDSCNLKSITPS